MSFLTDFVKGNWSNLGTDISHAPSSFANHPAEWAELGGGLLAATGVGLGLDAALAGGAVGGDLLAEGGATVGGELAGSEAAGGALAGDVAAGAGGAATDLGATLGTDLTAGELAAGAGDAAVTGETAVFPAGGDVLSSGGDVLASGDTTTFLPGAGDVATTDTPLVGTPAGGDVTTVAPGTIPGGTPTGPAVNATTTAAGVQPIGGGGTVAPVSGGTIAGGAGGEGGITGALSSTLNSPWTKLALGVAPLALTLARGQPSLSPAAQAAQNNAAQLSAFGNQQIQNAINGQLNAGQIASLNVMRQDLTNQWKQTLFNMGVTDPTKDTRWPQIEALIDEKVTQQTQVFTQQMIQNGLQAAGAASQTFMGVANLTFQQDQAFTNNLVNATKALGMLAGNSGQTFKLVPSQAA